MQSLFSYVCPPVIQRAVVHTVYICPASADNMRQDTKEEVDVNVVKVMQVRKVDPSNNKDV